MYAKFTSQTKRFVIVILIISFGISLYLLLRYNSTPAKYNTTSSNGRSDANNSGKKLQNKYKEAQKVPVLQNKSAPIEDDHDNKKRQKDLRDKANNYLSEPNSHPVYTKLFSFTRNIRENIELLDIMGVPPIKFDPAYKNPCFMGDKTNQLFKDGNLHCLPYFYLIGVKKSGTTDLFQRISAHPEFKGPGFKEAQWFPRMRFGMGTRAFSRKPIFKTEATPANLHMHTNWDLLPGNEGLTEPRYTNFHYIKHITPDAKMIIIFRDPVTRLFSDFKHVLKVGHHTASTEISRDFHGNVTVLIQAYVSCFRRFPMRRCIYNDTLLEKENVLLKDSFRAGFYAFFWEELLSVFRRDQVLPVHMTRYVTNTGHTLANTFKFLNMSPLSREKLSKIVRLNVPNRTPIKGQMNQETKDMLYKFYEPYNNRMAELMNDNAYLFRQS